MSRNHDIQVCLGMIASGLDQCQRRLGRPRDVHTDAINAIELHYALGEVKLLILQVASVAQMVHELTARVEELDKR